MRGKHRPHARRPEDQATCTLGVRLTPAEAEAIRRRAEADGCTYSDLVRRAVQLLLDDQPMAFVWRPGDNPNITVDYGPAYADAN